VTTERASDIAARLVCALLERSKEHEIFEDISEEGKERCTMVGRYVASMYKEVFEGVMEMRAPGG
jgi:hypothetical protein